MFREFFVKMYFEKMQWNINNQVMITIKNFQMNPISILNRSWYAFKRINQIAQIDINMRSIFRSKESFDIIIWQPLLMISQDTWTVIYCFV